jgi:hypothetical protein
MLAADHTTLERVRLRHSQAEPTLARLRLSHLLSTVELQPRAMPPAAILMVHAMDDPLPGRITQELGPGARLSGEWERAAQNKLGEFYSSAVRPIRQAVPANAPAVLFADYGELLACLARDLATTSALGWWWQSLLRRIGGRLPGSWPSVWAEHPLYVPAALQHLEARGEVATVLQRISPVQVWNLLMIVLRAFELPRLIVTRRPTAEPALALPNSLASWREHLARKLAISASQTAGGSSHGARCETSPPQARAPETALLPWEPYVPPACTPEQLGYERQALLGVGLLLRRAPQVAFTSAFAARFRAWVSNEQAPTRAPEVSGTGLQTATATLSQESSAGIFQQPFSVKHPAQRTAPIETVNPTRPTGEATEYRSDVTPAEAMLPDRPPLSNLGGQLLEIPRTSQCPWESGQFTRAGGILYLIHLLRQSELLRHFDTGLSGWALLELLSRCLLDDVSELGSDPIWDALASLDGRDSGTRPGADFQPQPNYSAPAAWLEAATNGRQAVRFRSRGIEVWSAQGFLLLDSPETGQVPEGLIRTSRAQRRRFRRPARVRPSIPISRELRRFLHFVLPYARWRLDRALRGAVLPAVLLRPGTLYVTGTHVDLVMAMHDISLPARIAGLDANPGWVPELGRVVNFHFVQES